MPHVYQQQMHNVNDGVVNSEKSTEVIVVYWFELVIYT